MTRSRVTSRQKRIVRERAKYLCEYCRSPMGFATHAFSIEHIVPVYKGGRAELDNLALACQGCNNFKYVKTEAHDPVSKKLVPLFHPRRHKWQDHFVWNHDSTKILGLTPTGRATIKALKLNRKRLMSLRTVLYAAGKHPPREDPHRIVGDQG